MRSLIPRVSPAAMVKKTSGPNLLQTANSFVGFGENDSVGKSSILSFSRLRGVSRCHFDRESVI